MPVFLLGLLLGTLSGVGTWLYTTDTGIALIVALAVAIITWLGIAVIAVIDA